MSKIDNLDFESYKFFSNLISQMPMIFYVLDKNWNFLLSDGKGLEKLGLKPGEAVGKNAKEMYGHDHGIIEMINRAYSGENIKYDQVIGDLYLEDFIAPIVDKNGEIQGVIGASIDVTDRKLGEKELEKTRAIYEALIESAPGMIYMYNDVGELVFWNKTHETLTGFSKEELYHRSLMEWYKDDLISQEAIMKGLENTTKFGFGDAEADLQCKDGSVIPVYLTAAPLKVDGKDYFVGAGVDISSQIEAKNKLFELNNTLEEKVKERSKKLKSANEELAAMNEEVNAMNEELNANNTQLLEMQGFLVESEKMAALGGLVAGVAHEVNTPIGVGLTAASHLSDISRELLEIHKKRPLNDEDIVFYLEDIEKASQIIFKNLNRAAHLVHSFKQLSVDQSNEPKRAFDIGAYIEEVLVSLSPSLKKTRITIENSCPEQIIVKGYPGLVAQIITNLVMNSIKHAYKPDEVGKINIETSRKNSMIQIVYSDDGCGMDENTVGKIYEPFYTTNRTSGGTGLGLSIVYSIVTQKCHGKINCISMVGKGTKFEIILKEDI